MSEKAKPTVLHPDVFEWYEGDGVAFLCEKTTARVYAATDAIQTLTALLLQREIDAEAQANGDEPGVPELRGMGQRPM